MRTEYIDISIIKENPDNPRVIKNDKFKKLVKSINDFPQMLEVRPIVINKDNIVLGGNMRLRACKEAGLKQVPVVRVNDWSPEKEAEFVIKDNVSGGEWDWDIIANDWEVRDLLDWGFDMPNYVNNDLIESINEMDEWVGMPEFEAADAPHKLIIQFETEEEREKYVERIDIKVAIKNKNAWSTWYPYKEREVLNDKKYE